MQPLHDCIDNAIHSGAGPMLRDDCAEIIHRQKSDEETAMPKSHADTICQPDM